MRSREHGLVGLAGDAPVRCRKIISVKETRPIRSSTRSRPRTNIASSAWVAVRVVGPSRWLLMSPALIGDYKPNNKLALLFLLLVLDRLIVLGRRRLVGDGDFERRLEAEALGDAVGLFRLVLVAKVR